jgi:hypothetical protein
VRTFSRDRTPFCSISIPFPLEPQPSLEHQGVNGGAEFQLKQKVVEKYIKYKFPTSHPGWKDLWFYIGNHKPSLAVRTGGVPKPQPEWNQNPPTSEMEQVEELPDVIQALKLMGITGASVMYSFFERRVQPLQKRCQSGFDYLVPEDPSWTYVDKSQLGEELNRVKHILMDVHYIPYVPELFSASN